MPDFTLNAPKSIPAGALTQTPAGGACSAPLDPLAGFNEPTSNSRGGGARPVCLLVLTILATGLRTNCRETARCTILTFEMIVITGCDVDYYF